MKKASLAITICAAMGAIYVLGQWLSMYPENGNFNQFTVWRDDLSPDGSISTEWAFFVAPDFPTGKCEILFDMAMSTIGLILLGIATVFGYLFLKLHRKQIQQT